MILNCDCFCERVVFPVQSAFTEKEFGWNLDDMGISGRLPDLGEQKLRSDDCGFFAVVGNCSCYRGRAGADIDAFDVVESDDVIITAWLQSCVAERPDQIECNEIACREDELCEHGSIGYAEREQYWGKAVVL